MVWNQNTLHTFLKLDIIDSKADRQWGLARWALVFARCVPACCLPQRQFGVAQVSNFSPPLRPVAASTTYTKGATKLGAVDSLTEVGDGQIALGQQRHNRLTHTRTNGKLLGPSTSTAASIHPSIRWFR